MSNFSLPIRKKHNFYFFLFLESVYSPLKHKTAAEKLMQLLTLRISKYVDRTKSEGKEVRVIVLVTPLIACQNA